MVMIDDHRLRLWGIRVVGTLKAFLDPHNYLIVDVGCGRVNSRGALHDAKGATLCMVSP